MLVLYRVPKIPNTLMIFNLIPHAELCNRNIERIMDHFDKNINKLGLKLLMIQQNHFTGNANILTCRG